MKKVTGTPDYSIHVECPECSHSFDLADGNHDDEGIARKAMFKNTFESCTNMDFLCVCEKCDCEFILDELEC